jgi:xanthine dehydrogenase accessory factor
VKELFFIIKERLLRKESLVLVTVIETSGSTPRGAGARMLVGGLPGEAAARLWGSIGGGLPESLAIEEASALLRNQEMPGIPSASLKKYALHSGEAANLGARCGGEISVFSRTLNAGEPGLLEVIEKAISSFSNDKSAWLIMEIPDDTTCKKPAMEFFVYTESYDAAWQEQASPPANLAPLLKAEPVYYEAEGKLLFSEPFISGGFVYVFGGGHVAQELIPLLARLNFRCVVFDDREEFSEPGLFPLAEKTILGDFERIGNYLSLNEKDYVVVVTRGHEWDLECWAFALNSPAAYIGVIGSKAKHGFVKEQLRERGFEDTAINAPRVHAPIGMDIKSKTPAEIAVSIAGELILTRASLRYFI